jgi:copper chaperone CopZ
MVQFIHHVPGRLRVKTATIKGRGIVADKAIAHLGGLEGITSVAANAVTGSIVINYDAAKIRADRVLDSLKQGGYIQEVTDAAFKQPASAARIAGRVGDTLLTKLVETVVERSAVALIGALI